MGTPPTAQSQPAEAPANRERHGRSCYTAVTYARYDACRDGGTGAMCEVQVVGESRQDQVLRVLAPLSLSRTGPLTMLKMVR